MAKEIIGLESLIKKLDKMGGNTKQALQRAVQNTTLAAQNSAKKHCITGKIAGGNLKQNIFVKFEDDRLTGVVFNNVPYAQYIEFGTGPVGAADHAGISPHVAVSYADSPWVYPTGETDEYGNPEFVKTSGQPARPFMYPAAKENESTFENSVRKEVTNAILKLGG